MGAVQGQVGMEQSVQGKSPQGNVMSMLQMFAPQVAAAVGRAQAMAALLRSLADIVAVYLVAIVLMGLLQS